MRKTVTYLLALALLLSACGENSGGQQTDYGEAITCLAESWEAGEELLLQRKLAMWYNANLISEFPEPGFRQAYNRILYYEQGMMGYLEIPSQGISLPIFHDGGAGGFIHDAASAFPIGGRGNHTVLTCADPIELNAGDVIRIHVLGEALTYQVGQGGRDLCTLICGEEIYACGRIVEE